MGAALRRGAECAQAGAPDAAAEGGFLDRASKLAAFGLVLFPVGGDTGKRPLIRGWRSLRRPPTRQRMTEWARRFPDANVGLPCGAPNGILVVDWDDPARMPPHGESPLAVATPGRGGRHDYFAFYGEPSAKGDGFDLLSDGKFVVAAGSRNPVTGGFYVPLLDGYERVGELPRLPSRFRMPSAGPKAGGEGLGPLPGERNRKLFRHLLREARHCDDLEALLDVARTWNDDLIDPLPDGEVVKTSRSAWGYEEGGKNWAGRGRRISFSAPELERLLQDPTGPDAMILLARLRLAHGARSEFACSPTAMARARVVPFGKDRIRAARDVLIRLGLLVAVHRGGARKGDASLFAFGEGF